jgi:hypothetical protein
VIHTLAVLVVAADLTGSIVALLDRGRADGTEGTPVALTCCPVLRATWPAPNLIELMRAVRSDPRIPVSSS